jgi:hypothetical protein
MGQLSFEGREVAADLLSVPGFGAKEYELPPDFDAGSLRHGDRIRVLVEYTVEDVHYPLKVNKRGVAVDKLKQVVEVVPVVPETVQVEGVLRAADVEAAWLAKVNADTQVATG